jgi:ATP-binding cassette subfamily B protein
MSPRFVPASVAELSRVGLLAELPGEQLTKLAARMRREDVAAGSGVIAEGEEGDRFYVIVRGLFAVSNLGGLGPRRVLRPGEYFGEVALAMDVPRTASVTALTPSTVASCDRTTFEELVRPLFADGPEP